LPDEVYVPSWCIAAMQVYAHYCSRYSFYCSFL